MISKQLRYLSCHALQKMKMLFALFMLLCSGEEVAALWDGDSSIVDLGFKQEIADMNEQIDS